jgi:hypothetical protein
MSGAVALTSWVLYFVYGMVDEASTQGIDRIDIIIAATTLLVALAADFAAYKIARAAWVLQSASWSSPSFS